LEFYVLKNVKKKAYSCIFNIKKNERPRQPALPTPNRSKKSILIFANFFAFLAPPAQSGSNRSNEYIIVHRSEVNIYRVMTRNESAVFLC
jgi:hypothetical protein